MTWSYAGQIAPSSEGNKNTVENRETQRKVSADEAAREACRREHFVELENVLLDRMSALREDQSEESVSSAQIDRTHATA